MLEFEFKLGADVLSACVLLNVIFPSGRDEIPGVSEKLNYKKRILRRRLENCKM